jgi:dephospho-CoA kinase
MSENDTTNYDTPEAEAERLKQYIARLEAENEMAQVTILELTDIIGRFINYDAIIRNAGDLAPTYAEIQRAIDPQHTNGAR